MGSCPVFHVYHVNCKQVDEIQSIYQTVASILANLTGNTKPPFLISLELTHGSLVLDLSPLVLAFCTFP